MISWRALDERRRHQYWRAAVVGLAAGGVALAFQEVLYLAGVLRIALWDALQDQPHVVGLVLLPLLAAAAGGLAAWLTARYAPEAAGSGVPHIKGVLVYAGELRGLRVLLVKFFGGLLAIGSGFSLGREGPTVQMGAAAGKLVGQWLRVPPKAEPRLIACGAGAGLAAAFHAPLAGFIFTIEELQREFSSLTYSMALVAAVVADIVAISYLGSAEAFHPAGFPALTLTALPACVVIGALAGALGTAFNKSLLAMQAFVRGQITLAPWQRAAAIGLVVGVVIWYVPDLAGGGHHTAERLLDAADAGATEVPYLLLLLVGKFALTLLCYCAGVPGGIFAPMLLIGACLGILTGIGTQALAPAAVAIPESLAAIGMAAFFSAVVRAPLTGIVLVLQMTGDWNQLLPLLTAAMIAYVVSEKLKTEPIYEALLHADTGGRKVDIPSQREPVLIEFIVQQESAMDGKAIRALPLPKRCLFVTITRQGEDLLPNGDTVLHSGDHVTAVLSGPDPSASVVRVLALSKA